MRVAVRGGCGAAGLVGQVPAGLVVLVSAAVLLSAAVLAGLRLPPWQDAGPGGESARGRVGSRARDGGGWRVVDGRWWVSADGCQVAGVDVAGGRCRATDAAAVAAAVAVTVRTESIRRGTLRVRLLACEAG
ncbi:hypothetical protein HOK021_71860 [Streptomyces hygroscopicus]|nr:hypothetical protein HOK021_71860 [Streptomyces hygroscopicus]